MASLLQIPMDFTVELRISTSLMWLNALLALIQAALIVKNFTFSFFILHGWEIAVNLAGIAFMALFSYRQDITKTLADFKETHSWNAYSMGRKIHEEIKCDAARKIALFILFSLLAAAANIMAGTFYSDIMQSEFLILVAIQKSFCRSRFVYACVFGLTLFNTASIFTAFRYFYHLIHLKYQFLLFNEYVKNVSRKLKRLGDGNEARKELLTMIERHKVLKQWSLLIKDLGKPVLIVYILLGSFLVFCTSLTAIFIAETRFLFGLVIILEIAYVHCLAHFGQHFENMFEELYYTTVQSFCWYDWHLKDMKCYLFMIQNMQRTLKLEIPRLIALNYSTEVKILRGFYTLGSMIVTIAARHYY